VIEITVRRLVVGDIVRRFGFHRRDYRITRIKRPATESGWWTIYGVALDDDDAVRRGWQMKPTDRATIDADAL